MKPGRKLILKMLNIGIKTEHHIAPVFRKLIKILSLNPTVGLLKTYRVSNKMRHTGFIPKSFKMNF